MKKILSSAMFAVFAFGLFTACQTASTANVAGNNANKSSGNAAPQTDDAPRISLADAKKDFDAGTAIFVDTRSVDAWRNERIKGSINITSETFEAKYKELPTDKKIIAYCS